MAAANRLQWTRFLRAFPPTRVLTIEMCETHQGSHFKNSKFEWDFLRLIHTPSKKKFPKSNGFSVKMFSARHRPVRLPKRVWSARLSDIRPKKAAQFEMIRLMSRISKSKFQKSHRIDRKFWLWFRSLLNIENFGFDRKISTRKFSSSWRFFEFRKIFLEI